MMNFRNNYYTKKYWITPECYYALLKVYKVDPSLNYNNLMKILFLMGVSSAAKLTKVNLTYDMEVPPISSSEGFGELEAQHGS